ncbi:MAG: hypothetical protein HY343_04895 [Lentisphaerae bacterium]|nr:hypothetical protein [Lentisphaerota bacterium]
MGLKNINTLTLSIYQDLAEAFVASVTGGRMEDIIVGENLVHFDLVSGDPGQISAWDRYISRANAIAIVVRFIDVLSLEKIKLIYRALPTELNMPLAVFLLRDKGEIDFKISCPSCGQKLWLRDTDVGRRGRCPNCKKPFVILSQGDHLKTQLMLPESIHLETIVRDDPTSARNALNNLLESMSVGIKPAVSSINMEALKNATGRIQLTDP